MPSAEEPPLMASLLLLSVLASSCAAIEFNHWHDLTINVSKPQPRAWHSANAVSSSQMLLFGGIILSERDRRAFYNCYNDTWLFDGNANVWEPQAISSHTTPRGRAQHASVVFETAIIGGVSANNVVVIQGGFACAPDFVTPSGAQENRVSMQDTWVYFTANQTWRHLDAGTNDLQLYGHAAAAWNNSLYIYGGFQSLQHARDDIYSYNLDTSSWTNIKVAGSIPRLGMTVSALVHHDSPRWYIAGGIVDTDSSLNQQTYMIDFEPDGKLQWSQTNPLPVGRGDGASVAIGNDVITIGGIRHPEGTILGNVYDNEVYAPASIDVLKLNTTSNSWSTLVSDEAALSSQGLNGTSPAQRQGHSAITLQGANGPLVLIFGGINTFSLTFFNDLWSFSPNTRAWREVDIPSGPPASAGAVLVPLSDDNVLYSCGWTVAFTATCDSWLYNALHNTFHKLQTTNPPPARALAHAQRINNTYVLLHGGTYIYPNGSWAYFNDFWFLNTVSFTWTQVNTTLPTRGAGSMIYYVDALYLFGGKNDSSVHFDVIESDLNGNYSSICHEGPVPTPRWGHVATHRSFPKPVFLILGGRCPSGSLSDLWEFSLVERLWRMLAPNPLKTGLVFASALPFLDPDRLLVVGGATQASAIRNPTALASGDQTVTTLSAWIVALTDGTATAVQLDSVAGRCQANVVAMPSRLDGFAVRFMGGITNGTYAMNPIALNVGCNPGSYSQSIQNKPCQPCPKGFYSDVPGAIACNGRCTTGVTTPGVGSNSKSDCSVCEADTCHGHGQCHVTTGYSYLCRCYWGYGLSKDCNSPTEALVIVGSCIAMLLVGAGLSTFHRRMRKLRAHGVHVYSQLVEREEEVRELNKDWLINKDELEFLKQLDEGTYAQVWLAKWQKDLVAVKRLTESLQALSETDDTVNEEFEREIRALRRTRHPNIVLFFGAGQWGGNSFLVLEFCHRGSVRGLLDKDWESLLAHRHDIALDAARGMRFLHSQTPARVHRDFKTANLLVTERWVTKVADLATLRMLNQGQAEPVVELPDSKTMTTLIGTIPYMAPEVVNSSNYTTAVDVFSYGVVLWELYSEGLEPYHEFKGHALSLIREVSEGRRPVPHPKSMPDSLTQIMVRCWAAEPERRPSFHDIVTVLGDQMAPSGATSSEEEDDFRDIVIAEHSDEVEWSDGGESIHQ
eukprot:m.286233 g.286233  ORF g.286233 m.286233 type:complete len:1184 (+) comp17778_c0_seq16:3812-7363(+)